MLKQLRTNTKWIMIVVVVGFIAMIVFDWGMDISSRRQGVDAGIVGSINGVNISYTDYDQLIRNQTQALAPGQRQTLDQLRQIHNEVWEYLITQTLIEQEIEKRGLAVSDQELMQYIMTNPAQYMDQMPVFQDENGQFSLALYRQFLQNPQNLQDPQTRQVLDYIEAQARSVMPALQLQNDLMNSIMVTDADVRDEWLNQTETRVIDYVHLGMPELNRVTPPGDDAALQSFYDAHKADYAQPELRSVEAVFFPLTPTAADTAMVRETADMLVQRIRGGEDFAELADAYTEDPGNTSYSGEPMGGELGFFGRGEMVKPFEDAAFALQAGEVSDPIETQYGIHVIKADSLVYNEDDSEVEQVSARHILLTYEPSGETQQAAENTARAFYEEVSGGADFTATADRDGFRIQGSPLFRRDAQMVPNIGSNTELLMARIFDAGKGDVLPLYQTDNGYYVIHVADVVHAGTPSLDNVRTAVTNDYLQKFYVDYAADYLARVDSRIESGMTLQEAIAADSDTLVSITVSTQEITRSTPFAGLGAFNALAAHVFKLDNVGDCTGPVRTSEGAGLAVLVEKPELDEELFDEQKDAIRQQVTSRLQNEVFTRYLEKMREDADIVDNRSVFLSL